MGLVGTRALSIAIRRSESVTRASCVWDQGEGRVRGTDWDGRCRNACLAHLVQSVAAVCETAHVSFVWAKGIDIGGLEMM
jgi:hypothetical protein